MPRETLITIKSVNVGEPRTIELAGAPVVTSIFKEPVSGAVEVGPRGLAGDHRISPRSCDDLDHAVYLYPLAHYADWQRELGVASFPCGQFGENLTVDGLLESEVRVGDWLRCGSATLQVVQPRLPCKKLNARMGRRFAGTFLRSGRLGFYCRVLEPGQVAAGDRVEIVDSDPGSPTMAEFIRISQHDYWDADGLATLLAARGLPDWWRERLTDKLDRARSATGWFGLRELEVVRREQLDDDTASLWLACAQGQMLPGFRPGQHLGLALRIGPDDAVVRRSYAITSDPAQRDAYRITVRLARAPVAGVADGLVSSTLIRGLDLRDRVRASAPCGDLTLGGVDHRCPGLWFVAQGIALSSVIGCIREWRQRLSGVPARLLHQELPERSRLFADELDAARAAGLAVTYLGDSDSLAAPPDTLALVAGSTRFVDRITAALAGDGRTVRCQRYGPAAI